MVKATSSGQILIESYMMIMEGMPLVQCLQSIDEVGGEDTTARSFSLQYRVARLISEDINSINVTRGEDT